MGIADDLKAHRWAEVAKRWNGPGYAKNAYDTKLAAAYAKWAKIKDTLAPAPQPVPTPIQPKPVTIEPQPVPDGNWLSALLKAIAAIFTRKET
jgi:hypothetical protein